MTIKKLRKKLKKYPKDAEVYFGFNECITATKDDINPKVEVDTLSFRAVLEIDGNPTIILKDEFKSDYRVIVGKRYD